MDILDVKALYAGYGQEIVLRNINFTVGTGQFVCVIAPNGTGKSTLLKTIAGIIYPRSGAIYVTGESIGSYSRRELSKIIAVVSSDIGASAYTAWQMVVMGRFAHLRRFSNLSLQDHAIVQAAMEDVNIWHKHSCLCSELSQGEQQKVIIARALAQQPQLLLLDEPTAHLDIYNQFSILQLIKQNALQKGMAVMAVIHDINLALEFGTHFILIKSGQMLAYGPSQTVVTTDNLKELYGMDFKLYQDAAATYVRPNLNV